MRAAPGLARAVRGRMLTYGPFAYRSASGRSGTAALVVLSGNARTISLPVLSVEGGAHLAEGFAGRLPRASVGRSCVRFRRLAGVDPDVLAELVAEAHRRGPGEAAGPG